MSLTPAYDGPDLRPLASSTLDEDRALSARIDYVREAMESEMSEVRERCGEYLRWYSPPWNRHLLRHDAWDDDLTVADIGLTRGNYPVTRAVVDIWTSLEAGRTPSSRAEPERIPTPPPLLDEQKAAEIRGVFDLLKRNESAKADMRSWLMRQFRRQDQFPLKHFRGTRRKNLYGFSWMKVIPHPFEDRPYTYPVRNPTAVYPIWSSREPDDIESILCAYQESATVANAKYGLGLDMKDGVITGGTDSMGKYRSVSDTDWSDTSRTMVWIEEFWWVERIYGANGKVVSSCVCMAVRVCDRIVDRARYEGWKYVPFVPLQNSDERDTWGWSDVAGVIDINDEINRRLSQEGDIIGMYASPRFQLLGAAAFAAEKQMPEPFEMISLSDQERIEQILTRIDLFPSQVHFQTLIDLLHRVTGLPPIVWGLIANAQTSGRALTASWKATETRLIPKLQSNEAALRRMDDIILSYVEVYDWMGARRLFETRDGGRFNDYRWEFPPMEPRDFQEVTMNAITKRDAGLQTSVDAMREIGDEAAEDTLEEVRAEWTDPVLHADKVQSQELLQRARIDNVMMAQQAGMQAPGGAGGPPANAASFMQTIGAAAQAQQGPTAVPPGAEGSMPPTAPGAPGNVQPAGPPGAPPPGDPTLTSGTLMRGGDVSNQYLETRRIG